MFELDERIKKFLEVLFREFRYKLWHLLSEEYQNADPEIYEGNEIGHSYAMGYNDAINKCMSIIEENLKV